MAISISAKAGAATGLSQGLQTALNVLLRLKGMEAEKERWQAGEERAGAREAREVTAFEERQTPQPPLTFEQRKALAAVGQGPAWGRLKLAGEEGERRRTEVEEEEQLRAAAEMLARREFGEGFKYLKKEQQRSLIEDAYFMLRYGRGGEPSAPSPGPSMLPSPQPAVPMAPAVPGAAAPVTPGALPSAAMFGPAGPLPAYRPAPAAPAPTGQLPSTIQPSVDALRWRRR